MMKAMMKIMKITMKKLRSMLSFFTSRFRRGAQISQSSELSAQQRKPRIFILANSMDLPALKGVELILPDRKVLPILEISLSGLIVPSRGVMAIFKMGQVQRAKLRLIGAAGESDQVVALELKVASVNANWLGFQIQTVLFDQRLKITQNLKDFLAVNNLQNLSGRPWYQVKEFTHKWHGPFDTNILFDENSGRFLVEYDGLLVQAGSDPNDFKISRGFNVSTDVSGYFLPQPDAHLQKVSIGRSWLDRLTRLLHAAVGQYPEIELVRDKVLPRIEAEVLARVLGREVASSASLGLHRRSGREILRDFAIKEEADRKKSGKNTKRELEIRLSQRDLS